MPLFLNPLKAGGADRRVEPIEQGINIRSIAGRENAFPDLARRALDRSGADFTTLPRRDKYGAYDRVDAIVRPPG